ncbi:hypothetical protein J1907_09070 [Lysinibacillus sphaericus]|uniref:hypothetical protein n=1 Tax=Lysinibacillus sphaericus TaxID=1421 RepID=UPI001A9F8828|nr:hypothetical protein [Lysinibacillus sphaericus]QTB24181.1 hypothetical protein J1907_09070 [Lysinibacillus sphaericus]
MEKKTIMGEVMVFRKYLSMISLLLFSLFILFAFITPIVVNGTSEIGDIVVISLILASFLAALFSQKGKLKIVALIVSLMPVLLLVGYLLLPSRLISNLCKSGCSFLFK